MEPAPFQNLSSLIAWANRTGGPNAVHVIVDQVKQAIRNEVDPYALAGALVESIILTVSAGIREGRRPVAAANLLRLMHDRLVNQQILPSSASSGGDEEKHPL